MTSRQRVNQEEERNWKEWEKREHEMSLLTFIRNQRCLKALDYGHDLDVNLYRVFLCVSTDLSLLLSLLSLSFLTKGGILAYY